MPKYITFLRAINVGGHTVKMDRLCTLFESMEFSNVETFIASGNVIFNSPSKSIKTLEGKIEKLLQKALGYEVSTFIRTPYELTEIVEYKPFKASDLNDENNFLYIGFTTEKPTDESKKKLMSCATKYDEFHIYGREIYWLCRKKFSDSEFSGGKLEKILDMKMTIRNSTTVKKLVALYGGLL